MKTTFLPCYRRGQNAFQTHFCPGCGHGNLLKMVDRAVCELNAESRTVWVSPVGCGGLTDSYLSVSHILSAHGRASAVAAAFKRLHPETLTIVSQGDGDLASIGIAEAVHAANRCENITVFFMNNANFAMTGGQMAPTTLLEQRTATSPDGRNVAEHGAPIRMCELLQTLEGPALIARVAFGSVRQLLDAQKVIRMAIENQLSGRGFSFVEILSPCPSNWHMSPQAAREFVGCELVKTYPLGIFRDISRKDWISGRRMPTAYEPASVQNACETLSGAVETLERPLFLLNTPLDICCAGFGGQGVMTLGRLIARLALFSGYEATWIPSYGPEMRGGVANCFVRISKKRIDSPAISAFHALIAMNQPALDHFMPHVSGGGYSIYDANLAQPGAPEAGRAHLEAVRASDLAGETGTEKNANFVLFGKFLVAVLHVENIAEICEKLEIEGEKKQAVMLGAVHYDA